MKRNNSNYLHLLTSELYSSIERQLHKREVLFSIFRFTQK